MPTDCHGQPAQQGFNRARNAEKAAAGLLGILHGITVDNALNAQELLFLDVWLRSQEHLQDDGDLIDLLDAIGDILSDGLVSTPELDDLRALAGDVLRYRKAPSSDIEATINTLLGFLSGIVADGVLSDSEIDSLSTWLNENQSVAEVWPGNVIAERLHTILEDGIVDEEERADLLETLKQIAGARFEETGLAHGMATEFLEDPIETICHDGACFCFTGKFVTGGRKTVELTAVRRGARTKPNVSKEVNFLVIGTIASRDWRFSSHGRKIEEALRLKAAGVPISILTERTWLRLCNT